MPQCPATFANAGGLLYCLEEAGHSGSHRTVDDARRIGRAVRERLATMTGPDAYRDPAPVDGPNSEQQEANLDHNFDATDAVPGVPPYLAPYVEPYPGGEFCVPPLQDMLEAAHARGVREERERVQAVLESEETMEDMRRAAARVVGYLYSGTGIRAALAALRERLR